MPESVAPTETPSPQSRSGFPKGISPNPGGRPKLNAATPELLDFRTQPLEKQVDHLKERFAEIAYLTTGSMLGALKRSGKKDTMALQREVVVAGTAFDKINAQLEPEGLTINIPAKLASSLKRSLNIEIGIEVKAAAPAIDIEKAELT